MTAALLRQFSGLSQAPFPSAFQTSFPPQGLQPFSTQPGGQLFLEGSISDCNGRLFLFGDSIQEFDKDLFAGSFEPFEEDPYITGAVRSRLGEWLATDDGTGGDNRLGLSR
jgi:hypothetical protein